MRLGADCAEELKLRARERAQCAPRTRHAFTEQEWRIHHPKQTRFGITRSRNKAVLVFQLQVWLRTRAARRMHSTVQDHRMNRWQGHTTLCL